MLKLLLLATFACVTDAVANIRNANVALSSSSFDEYVKKFNRSYQIGSEEYLLRKKVFEQRLAKIQAHNANPTRLWTAGLNSITDLTHDEFAQKLGWRRTTTQTRSSFLQLQNLNSTSTTIMLEELTPDWTHLLMANTVPDQGSCGSCWAVAAMSLLQGRYESQLKRHRTFSAQELVSCVENPKECGGQGGCQGATVELAMEYVERKGLQDASAVPYLGVDKSCSSSFLDVGRREDHDFKLAHWEKLPVNEAEPLMRAVVEGPVAVSVGASSWDSYAGGVFDGCSKDVVINHAVTMFGYGKTSKAKYWKIRNSWGQFWGENGYIRLLRQDSIKDEDKLCGIDHNPGEGVACKPYPDKVTVCGMCGVLYDSVAVHFQGSSTSSSTAAAQPQEWNADVYPDTADRVGIGPIN